MPALENSRGMPQAPLTSRTLRGLKQIADYCQVTLRTVRRWIRDRAFPHRRVGARIEATTAQIDAWEQPQQSRPVAQIAKR